MKADKYIVEQRVNELIQMLLNGNSREDIILYCSETWNIGERQSDKYISRAKDKIEKSVRRKVEYDYSKAVRRYEDLYKLSIDKKDYKTALAINKELTNLQGLSKIQIEHSGDVQFICNVPD
jgi:hypothetical protein